MINDEKKKNVTLTENPNVPALLAIWTRAFEAFLASADRGQVWCVSGVVV